VVTYQTPALSMPSGALLWIHGGGTVMGTVRQGHAWCSRVADELGALVVSVDYRLAPENPYPAGLDDCYRALRWLHDNAVNLGIDPARIAVGKDLSLTPFDPTPQTEPMRSAPGGKTPGADLSASGRPRPSDTAGPAAAWPDAFRSSGGSVG
jgi:hypothetical protein